MYRLFLIFLVFTFLKCTTTTEKDFSGFNENRLYYGGLLTTSFDSFESLKEVIEIRYSAKENSWVELTHSANGGQVKSKLETGVSEADFIKAKEGGVLDKVCLALKSPYFVANRNDLSRVYFLSRRRHKDFGWPDKAFYDLAAGMKANIYKEDLAGATKDELSDKGYINTFNHIVAQALMTTLFSEQLADFVADTHERKNMPELISGKFSQSQLDDIKNGAVDNYVDIINNEWGQELGKFLKNKYAISKETDWDATLLSDYLNDCQSYFARVFMIRFKAFSSKDELAINYSRKINRILTDVSGLW